jgi:hypothetical protein
LRKLTDQEAALVFRGRGAVDLTEYLDAMRTLRPGDVAAVEPTGLTSRATKRRAGRAASKLGYRLSWAVANRDDILRFRVIDAAARHVSENP